VKSRSWWIAIPVVALSTAIAGGALSVWYVASHFWECETDVRRTISSPNGKKSLVVFGRDCGATTGFNTQLSIAPAGLPFSPENNPAFFVTSGLHDVTARWLGDSTVEIALISGGDKIVRSEPNVGDVKVVYK
jgi:hypothetical protein